MHLGISISVTSIQEYLWRRGRPLGFSSCSVGILDFLNFTLSLSLHLLSLPHFMFLFWILPSSLSLKFQVTEKVAGIQKAS